MFVTNCHINYSNVCASKCRFCAYFREEGQNGAFTLTIDEIMEKAEKASNMGATELHIVGSLNPGLPFEYYEEILKKLHEKYPAMSLKAYTAVEIAHLSQISGMSVREVLMCLKKAGLTGLREEEERYSMKRRASNYALTKISGKMWLEVMETAHICG